MAKLITSPDPPTSASEGRAPCYVEAALEAEVMFDQLVFLLEHVGPSCPLGCPHCARLVKVQSLLLAPFQPSIQSLAPPRPIAA